MAFGTYAGGWRIIRTLGQRIAHLEPHQGFAAETSTAAILYTTAHLGFPVSTTHTISGSVLGAGAARRFSAVRWGIAGNILFAWVLTIPAAGSVAALMELVTRASGGEGIVLAIAAAMATGAFAFASGRFVRRRVGPDAASVVAPPA
jgi:PiT family inorganic phosphate transporter